MKARIGEQEIIDIPAGSQISKALGDTVRMYDTCGTLGLCPECRVRADVPRGCGRYYIYSMVKGKPDELYLIETPDGESCWADAIWFEDEGADNGKED